jgi:hypothetical protein
MGKASWLVCCDDCFQKAEGDGRRIAVCGDRVLHGKQPHFRVRTEYADMVRKAGDLVAGDLAEGNMDEPIECCNMVRKAGGIVAQD